MESSCSMKKIFCFAALMASCLIMASGRSFAAGEIQYQAIDSYLENELDRLHVPGATLVVMQGDQIMHIGVFGVADATGRKPTAETPFMIGSITKSITALAIMQLVDAGKVDIDAPIKRYLPWFHSAPENGAAITVRHLLNQNSGIPASAGRMGWTDADPGASALEQHARSLGNVVLHHPPGTTFAYANANYVLLGAIIESVSGQSYEAYIRDHIFRPLGLNTSFTSQSDAESNGMALGHRFWFGYPIAAPDMPFVRGMISAGYLISSARDMGRYLSLHINDGQYAGNVLLSAKSMAELQKPVARMNNHWSYAMGWAAGNIGKTPILWHNGSTPNFYSYMAILPTRKLGIAILVNADNFSSVPELDAVALATTSRFLGEETDTNIQSPSAGMIPMVPIAGALLALQCAWIAWAIARKHWRPATGQRNTVRWKIAAPLTLNLSWAIFIFLSPFVMKIPYSLMLNYMPDLSLLMLISAGTAVAWVIIRVWFTLQWIRSSDAAHHK